MKIQYPVNHKSDINRVEQGVIRSLTQQDLPKMMTLQREVTCLLERQDIFQADEENYIKRHIEDRGTALGCFVEDELIAYEIAVFPGSDEDNLGYDIGLKGSELLTVAHLESVVVHPDYRGNKLQFMLGSLLEKTIKKLGFTRVCATVSPYNIYSLKNLESQGFNVQTEKYKYGGKLRYILYKEIETRK